MARAWPYRDLLREQFDSVVELHSGGRRALLHVDGVNRRLRATKRARLTSILSGGAIPDRAEYRVVLEPEGTVLGSLDEDFAIESSVGDIVQLGNASWAILKVERGVNARRGRPRRAADPALLVRRGTRALRRAVARDRRGPGGGAEGGLGRRGDPSARGRGAAARGVRRRGRPGPGRGPDPQPDRPRALLRRERRDAAGPALPLRRTHQPRLRSGPAQALLPGLRLRAAGGGQRGLDRPVAQPAAQLPARRGLRLPAPRHPRGTS